MPGPYAYTLHCFGSRSEVPSEEPAVPVFEDSALSGLSALLSTMPGSSGRGHGRLKARDGDANCALAVDQRRLGARKVSACPQPCRRPPRRHGRVVC